MNAISTFELHLSPEEKQLVMELIDRERTHLPAEIHHTRTATFRDGLKNRLKILDELIVRLNAG